MAGSEQGPMPVLSGALKGIRSVIEQQPGPVVIVAHSLGAALAMAVLKDAPRNLVGFVALDAGPRQTDPAELSGVHKEIEATASRLFPEGKPTGIGDELEPWIRHMASSEEDQNRLVKDFRASPADLLRDVFVQGRKLQLAVAPSHFAVPILVLVPYENLTDCAAFRADFEERFSGAADVTVVTVPAARHYLMLDNPEATARAIERFLARFDPVRMISSNPVGAADHRDPLACDPVSPAPNPQMRDID
jgi:pimeloyl-ACP methyl ester carboxylesterase